MELDDGFGRGADYRLKKQSSPLYCLTLQNVHPAFIGAQYPYSVTTPSLAATAVSFPGVPVPSMTQIAVHPYHAETGLSLSSNVASEYIAFCHLYKWQDC